MADCHLSMKALAAVALVALMAAVAADGARILAVMPIPARSHHIALSAVTKALADKGHDVTFFSGLPKGNKINPANNKMFHIDTPFPPGAVDLLKEAWDQKGSPTEEVMFLMQWGVHMVNSTLSNPVFRAEVNKPGQKYDMILTEAFFFQEGFVGLGHQFNVPVVVINPFGASQWLNEYMGNPVNPSWVPSPFLGSSDHMSFYQRALNTAFHVFTHAMYTFYYLPNQQAVVQEHWPDAPKLDDMLRSRLSLALINNHYTLAYAAPMSPNVVEIGGIHVPEKPKALPKDLQDFMDSAKQGVVYFSMGSNLKTEVMPKDKSTAILGGLGALKERVLLKWDGPLPQDLSPNIRVIEWAPQGDLLAHPNMRAFFTHGGLLSTQESVFHGVPLIGMPVFGDQNFNMLLAEQKGFCVRVSLKDLTREKVDYALNEVLRNPKYKEAANRLSRLFRSKPKPTVAAVNAIEHVLQHGGEHMRPSSVSMPLYQLLLLDVALAALAPFLALLLCCRCLCCGKKSAAGSASTPAKRSKKNN